MARQGDQQSGCSTGKILAVVIPICVVVVTVAVTLILVLGKGSGTSKGTTPSAQVPTEEQVADTYDQIKQETNAAVKEITDLTSQQAMEDATAYQQEVQQADESLTQLASDVSSASASVEAAASEVSTAATEVTQTQQEYQAFLTEIESYYAYVEDLTRQAVEQVAYVKSALPTLQQVDQLQAGATELAGSPAPARQRQLTSLLSSRASGLAAQLKSLKTAPASLSQFGVSLQSLTGQLGSLSQQMSQALASGNAAAFNSLSQQMNASVSGTLGQLSSGLQSSINGFSSQLGTLSQKVDASIPKK